MMIKYSETERPGVYCGVCSTPMTESVDPNTGIKYYVCPAYSQLYCDNDYVLRYDDLDKRIVEKFREDYYSMLQMTLQQARLNLDMILPFLFYIRQECSSLSACYINSCAGKSVSDWRQRVAALYNRIREKEEEIQNLKTDLERLTFEWIADAPDRDQIDMICSLISRVVIYRDRFTLVYKNRLFKPNIEGIAELLASLSDLTRQAEEMKSDRIDKAPAASGEEEMDYD